MKRKNQDLGERIPAPIKTAIDDFVLWNDAHLSYEQKKIKFTPLYITARMGEGSKEFCKVRPSGSPF